MSLIRLVAICVLASFVNCKSNRSFVVDYENQQFLKDGEPFRYIAGDLHYFRTPRVLWRDRLYKYRAAGLNAVQLYIEWSRHEPHPEEFNFDGQNDLVALIELIQDFDMFVVLRPGPFINAERDLGGMPSWLLSLNPQMALRSSDPNFLKYVDRWFGVLLKKLAPLMYFNGGPILSAQVENEFGFSHQERGHCDVEYISHLRDLLWRHLGKEAVLFSTDPPMEPLLTCSRLEGVLTAIDFGCSPWFDDNVTAAFAEKTLYQKGPLVNSEFYPGWITHWGRNHEADVSTARVARMLDEVLAMNASVVIYMFHGGTTWGFEGGAEIRIDSKGKQAYHPMITSYQFDAPLDEAGDVTEKYFAVRDVIGKHVVLPDMKIPEPAPKMQLEPIVLENVTDIFDASEVYSEPVQNHHPLTFEALNLTHGFLRYSTIIRDRPDDPTLLTVATLRDRAQVFVDGVFQGTLARTQGINSLPVHARQHSRLDIVVENQGRDNFSKFIKESKGIIGNVTFGPVQLSNWTHWPLFHNWTDTIEQISKIAEKATRNPGYRVPGFYRARFQLENAANDTFLRLDGWHKGVAFLNGFNLGRYWPLVGPQQTLYVYKELFNSPGEDNVLVVFELEIAPKNRTVQFVNKHVLDGPIPFHE